jgi:CHAD domain-containing protein/transposase-like protein
MTSRYWGDLTCYNDDKMTGFPLNSEDKLQIEQLSVDARKTLQRRARLLLLYENGLPTREVAAQVGLSPRQTRYWRSQYQLRGMDIFKVVEKVRKPRIKKAQQISLPASDEKEKQVWGIPFPEPMSSVGMSPEDTMAEGGRKTLRFHFAEMLAHEPGTRLGDDPEELHDMRVATRRMRAAFAVFEQAFNPKITRPYVRGLRTTGRALGHTRDMDVILQKAASYLDGLNLEQQTGMQPLIQFWQTEQAQARVDMLTHLDSQKYARFIQKFNLFVNTPGMGALPIQQDFPAPHRVREVVPALIYTRLETVRAYETILAKATIAQLHALRIECKRLRYTVEFFQEVLGDKAKTIINELKGIQDHLGDLHDADVVCQIIRQFLTEWDNRQTVQPLSERQNPQPIVAYLAYQSAELHRLIVSFPQTWEHFNRPAFRMNLALAVAAL